MAYLPLLLSTIGSLRAAEPPVFYESKGEVVHIPVKLSKDDYLELAKFVRLQDGSVHLPRLFYGMANQTLLGVRKIEQEGSYATSIHKQSGNIILPWDEDIDAYILFVRSYLSFKVRADGTKDYKITPWTYLENPAKEVAKAKLIVIPSVVELSKQAKNDDLMKELTSKLEASRLAYEKRINTPTPPRRRWPF